MGCKYPFQFHLGFSIKDFINLMNVEVRDSCTCSMCICSVMNLLSFSIFLSLFMKIASLELDAGPYAITEIIMLR